MWFKLNKQNKKIINLAKKFVAKKSTLPVVKATDMEVKLTLTLNNIEAGENNKLTINAE
jgi:hypothetical protein